MEYLGQGNRGSNLGGLTRENIPSMMGSKISPRPIASSTRTVQIASTSGTQSASGRLAFSIATNKPAVVKPNSTFIACDLTATGGDGTTQLRGNFPASSYSSIISRFTATVGGQVADDISYYNAYHSMQVCHGSNSSYVSNDSRILEQSERIQSTGLSRTGIIIPLLSSFLNSPQGVPLFLLNQPIDISLELATLNEALCVAGGLAITGYTVSNAFLIYDEIQVDNEFVEMTRSELNSQNKSFVMGVTRVNGYNPAVSVLASYQIGAGLSSIRSVLFTSRNDGAANAAINFIGTGLSRIQLSLDGRVVNNYNPVDRGTGAIYVEMQKAFSNYSDTSVCSATTTASSVTLTANQVVAGSAALTLLVPNSNIGMSRASYMAEYFVGGINLNRFNVSEDLTFMGQSAQNILLEAPGLAGAIANVFVVYDTLVGISANGQVTILK